MPAQDLVWAGGEHAFLLGLGELRALQQRCDAGPGWVLRRLQSGHWLVEDIVDTIRLGLVGGGMGSDDARRLVEQHVVPPLGRFVLLAVAVLLPAVIGEADDPLGEAPAGGTTPIPTRSPEANGASPTSTAPAA